MGNVCPLCNVEHEHSHFSYEIRKYLETENDYYKTMKLDRDAFAKQCDILQSKLDVMTARITNWYIEFHPDMIKDLLEEIKEI